MRNLRHSVVAVMQTPETMLLIILASFLGTVLGDDFLGSSLTFINSTPFNLRAVNVAANGANGGSRRTVLPPGSNVTIGGMYDGLHINNDYQDATLIIQRMCFGVIDGRSATQDSWTNVAIVAAASEEHNLVPQTSCTAWCDTSLYQQLHHHHHRFRVNTGC